MPRSASAYRRRKRLGLRLAGFLAPDDPDDLTSEQRDKIGEWRESPWAFLTGTDVRSTATLDFPKGRPVVWTKDERDKKVPLKPFPAHLDYMRELLRDVFEQRGFPRERFSLHEAAIFAIEKTRQMYVSTGLLNGISWECAFHDARQWFVSKVTETESIQLITDKVRVPISHWPLWLQRYMKVAPRPADTIKYRRSGSAIRAVPMNFALREASGSTGDVFVDEAPLQDMLGSILEKTAPMATRIVMVGTPQLGGPGTGAYEFYQYVKFAEDEDSTEGLQEI